MGKNKLLGVAAAALATVSAGAIIAQDANAQATTSWSGAPRTREEDREFKVNGRMQYDVFSVDRDIAGTQNDSSWSGSYMRRAFIGVEGRFTENWRYNVKFDLAPSAADSGSEVKLDDAFLEYAGKNFSIFVGQNNAISHMEDRTSSNYTPFNERSMMNQISGYTKTFGVAFLTNGGNWSAGVGVVTDSLNDQQNAINTPASPAGFAAQQGSAERTGVVARGTWAPIYSRTPDGTTVLHLGVSARHRDDGTNPYGAYSARANQNSLSNVSAALSSGGSYRSDDTYGAEAAFQWNAFGVEAEYMQIEATQAFAGAAGGVPSERDLSAGYVDIFWSPTGESRNYSASDGSWGRISPRRTLGSDGGIGHIMLSARYEWLTADDLAFGANRGETTGYLAGVTWAPIGYVKFQLNYGQYETDLTAGTDFEDQTMSLRTQFDF
ncbi:MAG: porin [Caulobacterales bacterium]